MNYDYWELKISTLIYNFLFRAMEDPCNNIDEDPVSRERTKSMSNNRSFDGGGK